jgi:tetratricopeptide (TPR) repeat protein
VAALAVAAVAVAYAARTWQRNWDWQDNLALYRSMSWTAADSAKSRHNGGVVYQRQGRHEEAIAQYQRALDVYPYVESAFGIGISQAKLGRIDDAIRWYDQTLAIDPSFAKAHTNLCSLLLEQERHAEGVRACRRGLRHRPTDANLLKGLGYSLAGTGQAAMAVAVLRRAVAVGGPDAEVETLVARLEHDAR